MQKVSNPVSYYFDTTGALADGGKIYVGVVDGDPEADPITAYWDKELTIEATQPLRTIGGLVANGTTPAAFYVAEDDYSMRVRDYNDAQVFYSPSVFAEGTESFQPLSPNLTAISNIEGMTVFGRSLLTLPNNSALATATGIPNPLPAVGGNVSGNIIRQGAGVHAYWFDPAMTGGRIFLTAEGAGDPTSQPGDLWFTYAP